jgi:hypothetical protein
MLTAEIKINGRLIAHLYMVNIGRVLAPDETAEDLAFRIVGTGLYTYEYEYHEIGSKKIPKTGNIVHMREDGPLKLISICTEDMGL